VVKSAENKEKASLAVPKKKKRNKAVTMAQVSIGIKKPVVLVMHKASMDVRSMTTLAQS
jgi:hypothetical protein